MFYLQQREGAGRITRLRRLSGTGAPFLPSRCLATVTYVRISRQFPLFLNVKVISQARSGGPGGKEWPGSESDIQVKQMSRLQE